MVKNSYLLNRLETEKEFVNKMDGVFSNLRADFDVSSLIHSKSKIEELKKIHVDLTEDVNFLANVSVKSNGVLAGLRGTGKSHLLLLSRNKINESRSSFCTYINFKEHFNLGNLQIDNRFYVWIILKQLKKQLETFSEMNDSTHTSLIEKIMGFFNRNNAKVQEELERIFVQMETLISLGEKVFNELTVHKTESNQQEIQTSARAKAKISPKSMGAEAEYSEVKKELAATGTEYNSEIILDIATLKSLLVDLVETLSLSSLVFCYDEWSTLNKEHQLLLSRIILALSTSPLYHWIAYIPYKFSLGDIELTADMPITVDLDKKYIYENDNELCIKYFSKFVDKRFELVFGNNNGINIDKVLNRKNFEMIVKASMGNTRDFGLLVLNTWSSYRKDFYLGKRHTKFTKTHVVKAIKLIAQEKLKNIHNKDEVYAEKMWIKIMDFIGEKKHTHFCIELNTENQSNLQQNEIQTLLYHRLIHLRQNDVPPKDGEEFRLAIYAVDMSAIHSRIYEQKSEKKLINAVTDIKVIHNQIRRYIFPLNAVVNDFRIMRGQLLKCPKCGNQITSEMTYLWENKICTNCGPMYT